MRGDYKRRKKYFPSLDTLMKNTPLWSANYDWCSNSYCHDTEKWAGVGKKFTVNYAVIYLKETKIKVERNPAEGWNAPLSMDLTTLNHSTSTMSPNHHFLPCPTRLYNSSGGVRFYFKWIPTAISPVNDPFSSNSIGLELGTGRRVSCGISLLLAYRWL